MSYSDINNVISSIRNSKIKLDLKHALVHGFSHEGPTYTVAPANGGDIDKKYPSDDGGDGGPDPLDDTGTATSN